MRYGVWRNPGIWCLVPTVAGESTAALVSSRPWPSPGFPSACVVKPSLLALLRFESLDWTRERSVVLLDSGAYAASFAGTRSTCSNLIDLKGPA